MAGLGLKTFTASVLTASDVNGYLMQQTIMPFASASARTTAFSTAGVTASEGMLSYLKDVDQLEVYNGSSWVDAVSLSAWTSWSPTLSGGWLNGNGTWSAYYQQIGKTVHVQAQFTIGSTTTKGTGLTVSLPVTAARSNLQPVWTQGGSASAVLAGYIASTTTLTFTAINAAGTYITRANVTATVPYTWATNDTIAFNFTYEAA